MKISQIAFTPSRHTQLAVSTSVGLGICWCMNQLSAAKLTDGEKTALSWIVPAAELVNQIWKQTLVSQLPEARSNKILRIATDPKTYIAAYAVSKFIEAPFLGWPTAVVTALVVGAHSLKSSAAAIKERRDLTSIPVHLFNALGTSLLTLDVLGIRELVDRTAWEKALLPTPEPTHDPVLDDPVLQEELRKIREDGERLRQEQEAAFKKEIDALDRKIAEDRAAHQAEMDRLKEEYEKHRQKIQESLDRVNDRSTFKKGLNVHKEPESCPAPGKFDSNGVFKDTENLFERITHKDLNPDCVEHAKFILAQSKLPASSGKDGCDVIKQLHRQLSVETYPDKNKGNPLANGANANVNKAYDTLTNTFCTKSV